MRRLIIVVAMACLPVSVYAEEPAAATPAAPAAVAPAAAAVAAPTATTAPTAAAPAAAVAKDTATVLTVTTPPPDPEFKVPSEYKPRTQGLETVYCRTYQPVGSRVPRTDCYTKAQVKAIEEAAAAARRDIQQKAAGCVGNCGGG